MGMVFGFIRNGNICFGREQGKYSSGKTLLNPTSHIYTLHYTRTDITYIHTCTTYATVAPTEVAVIYTFHIQISG